MADPHHSREAMSPTEPGAYSAGTGGPRSGWRIYGAMVVILLAIVLLAVLWVGVRAMFSE